MLSVGENFRLDLLVERAFFRKRPRPSDLSSKKFAGISSFNLVLTTRTAPYEKRIIELLRNNKDKRARKLAKKRVCFRLETFADISWEHSSAQRRRLRNFKRVSQKLDGLVIRWYGGLKYHSCQNTIFLQ